jgi:hypothetical protein
LSVAASLCCRRSSIAPRLSRSCIVNFAVLGVHRFASTQA